MHGSSWEVMVTLCECGLRDSPDPCSSLQTDCPNYGSPELAETTISTCVMNTGEKTIQVRLENSSPDCFFLTRLSGLPYQTLFEHPESFSIPYRPNVFSPQGSKRFSATSSSSTFLRKSSQLWKTNTHHFIMRIQPKKMMMKLCICLQHITNEIHINLHFEAYQQMRFRIIQVDLTKQCWR